MNTKFPYKIFGRRQYEVNTDPLRRCYNGCHFKSEMVWTNWYHLGSVSSEEEANESVSLWKQVNPHNQYKWEKSADGESTQETEARVNSLQQSPG